MSDFELAVTEQERAAGQLQDERWKQAALLLHTAGCIILRDLLPQKTVEDLRTAFTAVLDDCIASKNGDAWYQVSNETGAVFWERASRWRIFPKLRPPFNSAELLANPIVMSLCADLLGDFVCKFVSSDTCVRGSRMQAPHRELSAGGASRPCAYILNIPLSLSGLENGPLEIWPGGTHLWRPDLLAHYGLSDDTQDGENSGMEAFANRFPSHKLTLNPGDVLVRDPGMLHRGTPNQTDEPRTMLTICYTAIAHRHDYGDIKYNLDDHLYEALPENVKPLFPWMARDSADAAKDPGLWNRRLFRL